MILINDNSPIPTPPGVIGKLFIRTVTEFETKICFKFIWKLKIVSDITKTDVYGQTPMHLACYKGHLHICKSPKDLPNLFHNVVKNYYINNICPYGDGYASQKIKELLWKKIL